MIAVRVVLGLLGLAAAAYGAVELLDLGLENLRATVTWLAAGVVLHDAVLAPLALGLWLVASRARGGRIPGAVVVGAIVLGTVTVVAIPLLGRFGARSDNHTLLDRNYPLGWLVLATLTVIVVGVAVALSRTGVIRTEGGGDDGAGAGRG
jgi:hypothetical protein